MWKCIHSITMNRYNLNILINSIMLLSTCESTQSSQKNDSNDSINSINQLNIHVDLFGNSSISLTCLANIRFCWPFWEMFDFVDLFWETLDFVAFWGYFESIQLIHSYQSLKVNRISHLLYENELTQSPINSLEKNNWINAINFAEKMNWFKSVNSVELIGMQICLRATRALSGRRNALFGLKGFS